MQDIWQFCQLIGLQKEGLGQAIFYPLLTTALLFLGPTVQRLTSKDDQARYPEPLLSSPAAWRDLFVAPLTEEFVFRCLVVAILLHIVSSSPSKRLPNIHIHTDQADCWKEATLCSLIVVAMTLILKLYLWLLPKVHSKQLVLVA